jgi:hypothetical protein
VLLINACGGSKQPADAPEAETVATHKSNEEGSSDEKAEKTQDNESAASADGGAVPTKCSKGTSPCTPDPAFTKKMCNGNFPSIALYLFGNGFPFTKGYLTRKTQAWNAAGGASDNSYLEFDEEVLLLVERAADKNGMQVSGAGGGYEALRWNGNCVTLAKEEVTLDKPPAPKATKIDFRFLDDNIQEALRKDEQVNAAYLARRKECKGATSGEVSLKCVKADAALSDTVISYLRKGGELPVPQKLP